MASWNNERDDDCDGRDAHSSSISIPMNRIPSQNSVQQDENPAHTTQEHDQWGEDVDNDWNGKEGDDVPFISPSTSSRSAPVTGYSPSSSSSFTSAFTSPSAFSSYVQATCQSNYEELFGKDEALFNLCTIPQRLVFLAAFIEAIAIFFFLWLFRWVFHNPYCGFLFQCGCTWNWAGGWIGCNVHDPTTPSCPWCSSVPPALYLVQGRTDLLIMFSSYLVASYLAPPGQRWSARAMLRRTIVPLIVYTIYNAAVALGFKIVTGYPHYMFWTW
mgnify:CR=1 FL=1